MKKYIQSIKDYIEEFRGLWAEADKEVRRMFILRYFAAMLGIVSFIALGVTVSWWASVCVFLMLTANNIEQRFR